MNKYFFQMNFKFRLFFKFISCTFKLLETSYSSVAYSSKNCFTKTVKGSYYKDKNEIFKKIELSALLPCNGDQEQLPSSVSCTSLNWKCVMSGQNFWYYFNLYCACTVLGLMAIYFLFGRKLANRPKKKTKKARKYKKTPKTRPRKQKMRFYKRRY